MKKDNIKVFDIPLPVQILIEQFQKQYEDASESELPEKYMKEIQGEIFNILYREQKIQEQKVLLPRKIKKGALKSVLGVSEDVNLQDLSEDEIFQRQKRQIQNEDIDYQTLIRRLNWQAVMNSTNNPDFSKKLRNVMQRLKRWVENE